MSDAERTEEQNQQIMATKECRVAIDNVLQEVKELKGSREVALSITKLQEAVMWLGMNLKALDEPSPYVNSYNPNNSIVEPTADGLKL